MNNRTQQRFDRSIADALETKRAANSAKPRRDVTPPKAQASSKAPKGRLYLDPQTGATVWEPKRTVSQLARQPDKGFVAGFDSRTVRP